MIKKIYEILCFDSDKLVSCLCLHIEFAIMTNRGLPNRFVYIAWTESIIVVNEYLTRNDGHLLTKMINFKIICKYHKRKKYKKFELIQLHKDLSGLVLNSWRDTDDN